MKKLALNKQIIAKLNSPEKVLGGEALGYQGTVLQAWGAAACVTHTENYCGAVTKATNCQCPTIDLCHSGDLAF